MKKERNILKRYFLWSAPTPFWTGWMLAGAPAVIIIFGAIIASIIASMVVIADPGRPISGMISVPLPVSGVVFGLVGLGVVLGGINYAVCRRFVSYRRGSGMFLIIGYDSGNYQLVAAGNPLWGKGFWVELPLTDRPHRIEFSTVSVPIMLKVHFSNRFNPCEVYEKIVAGAGYRSFDIWLREKFLAAVRSSVVEQVIEQVHERPLSELYRGLEGMDFPGKPLSNIDHITAIVTPTVAVSFK